MNNVALRDTIPLIARRTFRVKSGAGYKTVFTAARQQVAGSGFERGEVIAQPFGVMRERKNFGRSEQITRGAKGAERIGLRYPVMEKSDPFARAIRSRVRV